MSLTDQLLAAFSLYGLPVLFATSLVSAVGVPLPGSFVLIAAGAFSEQGQMSLWLVIGLGLIGAVLGDQLGYLLGRWGGRGLAIRLATWLHMRQRLDSIEASTEKWGGPGVFLSRWLIPQAGPPLNLVCGMISFPYLRFLVWDVAGELTWVLIYTVAGIVFSENVQSLLTLLGSLGWAAVGLLAAALFGWQLWRLWRKSSRQSKP